MTRAVEMVSGAANPASCTRPAIRILQVTPTIYSNSSVIGGGEKLVLYVDQALKRAARAAGVAIATSVLSFGVDPDDAISDHGIHYRVIAGSPWDTHSIDANSLIFELLAADVVYIHQGLTAVGMFVAAHARLLRRRVIGNDSGAGEYPMLNRNPDVARVYDSFHAQSKYAASSFNTFDIPIDVIPGPLDTETFVPPLRSQRDPELVVAVGRVMPHKGFDRIIRALPPTLSLVIVGQLYDAEYVAYLNDLAHGNNVTMKPGLSDADVRMILQHAGLFVHASTHFDYRGNFISKPELLGLAPLEALSCGLPTLVSNAGALPELSRLPGCLCFEDDRSLADLLSRHSAGTLPQPPEAEMHAAVDKLYGPLAFGGRLLTALMGSKQCAY